MFHPRLTYPEIDIAFGEPECACDLPGTPLQQSGTYAATLAHFGCTSALAELRAEGALIGRARIHLRKIGPLRLAWMPRGPVWCAGAPPDLCTRANAALTRAAPWRALWATSTDAGLEATGLRTKGLRASKSKQMAELDLRPDEAARRAAQHGKWRNRLAHAEKAGLTVTARPLDQPRDAPLLAAEMAQRKIRRYAALPTAFTERWAALAPEPSLMITAAEAGTPVAFMLMLLHGDTATYHIGWTGPRGRALSAHNLLLWRASCILSQRGYARLDLGLADPTRGPGLARFKLEAGAMLRDIGPTRLHL